MGYNKCWCLPCLDSALVWLASGQLPSKCSQCCQEWPPCHQHSWQSWSACHCSPSPPWQGSSLDSCGCPSAWTDPLCVLQPQGQILHKESTALMMITHSSTCARCVCPKSCLARQAWFHKVNTRHDKERQGQHNFHSSSVQQRKNRKRQNRSLWLMQLLQPGPSEAGCDLLFWRNKEYLGTKAVATKRK